ncbi:MAG: hypothetical protein WB495_21995 [Xanthobacteraceae bacterium]
MNAPFKHMTMDHAPLSAAMRLVAESRRQTAKTLRQFPRRPNRHVLSESIPLFYICQNNHGFWIARDAEGRAGGLFLRKESAFRFARRRSEPTGCAMMLLNAPIELDIENQGNRIAMPLGSAIDVMKQRAPRFAAFIGMAIAEWHKLVAEISSAFAGERKHRSAIEQELFHGQHWLSSKSDDDLPVP